MKHLFTLIFSSTLVSSSEDVSKYVILINQSHVLRPIPSDENVFWSEKKYFDTITIDGQMLVKSMENQIRKFKLVRRNIDVFDPFSIHSALIRFNGQTAIDTLYISKSFSYWKIKNDLFIDKSQFFRKRFLDILGLRSRLRL